METILKANKIPFKALDIATDEKARMLWGRRAGKDEGGRARKIPGLVQMGLVLGDLVEIEDWNEYGELKQHVTMYYDEFTTPSNATASKSVVQTPSGTPSKPPVNQKENVQPVTPAIASPKEVEPSKMTSGGQSSAFTQTSSFTLAMRQAGQEAAQKAKEVKKKVAETFVGVGKAEPETAKEDGSSIPPLPLKADPEQHSIDTATLAQSPTSTAWKREIHGKHIVTSSRAIEKSGSLPSPNSTVWGPSNTDHPLTMYRGSSVEEVSAECIKKIEEEETIPEEDEEDEDSEED